VSFFELGFEQSYGAGSTAWQLAVVPASVAVTSPVAVVRAKGASQDPWSKFCASGEISSIVATKDVAGSVSYQLRHASHHLKHVSCLGLC
jgi:hypothetical protein